MTILPIFLAGFIFAAILYPVMDELMRLLHVYIDAKTSNMALRATYNNLDLQQLREAQDSPPAHAIGFDTSGVTEEEEEDWDEEDDDEDE